MTSAIVIVICSAYLIVSAFKIFRTDLTVVKKASLTALRGAILLLLLAAFYEPDFAIRRLQPSSDRIPVLLDVSRSMQLFDADSLVPALLDNIGRRLDSLSPAKSLVILTFGDSLGKLRHTTPGDFNDSRSDFPPLPSHKVIANSQKLLVISDGNWTNTRLPTQSYGRKDVRYATLPGFAPQWFSRISTLSYTETAAVDSPHTATVEVYGYSPGSRSLRIKATGRGKRVGSRTMRVDSGFFRDTVTLNLPTASVGRVLYRLTATDERDSALSSTQIVQTIVPSKFTAAIYSPAPTLDNRFITLALQSSDQWTVIDSPTSSTDAFFLFDSDRNAGRLVGKTPQRAVIVYAGTGPCEGARAPVNAFGVIRSDLPSLPNAVLQESYPPPSSFFLCNDRNPIILESYLRAWIVHGRSPEERRDTVNALYSTTARRRFSLVVPVRGFWRWDFWPLGLNRGMTEFSFSKRLLSLVENQVSLRAAQRYYVFPEGNQWVSDSLRFRLIFPSRVSTHQRIRVSFTLKSPGGEILVDTSFIPEIPGLSRGQLRLPPLSSGVYSYESSVQTPMGTMSYRDSVRVVEENTEFHIRGQNTLLLDQVGRPLDFRSPEDLEEFVSELAEPDFQATIRHTIEINRSWWMFLFLVALLGTEWYLRRRWELD